MEVPRGFTPYYKPPPSYNSPSIDPGCLSCDQPVIFVPVIGGYRWVHMSQPYDHDVVMGRWWDTLTGEWVEGNPLRQGGQS